MSDVPTEITEPAQKDSVNVSFQCPKELYEKLSKEAEDEDRNISQQVRRIVRKYYEDKKPPYRGEPELPRIVSHQ